MRFTGITTALLAIAIAVTGVNADIVAFSGSGCTGGEGANVACNDGCVDFSNRHSFRVLVSGTRCISVYEQTSCSEKVGEIHNAGNGACSNVITGTNVQSFRCSPDNTCA